MEPEYRRCCGIDVHKKSISVCVLPPVGSRSIPLKEEKSDVYTRSETIARLAAELSRDGNRNGIHRPIFCAEQRVVREGSSPSGARMRGAISKSGDNTSLAGESGRYGEA